MASPTGRYSPAAARDTSANAERRSAQSGQSSWAPPGAFALGALRCAALDESHEYWNHRCEAREPRILALEPLELFGRERKPACEAAVLVPVRRQGRDVLLYGVDSPGAPTGGARRVLIASPPGIVVVLGLDALALAVHAHNAGRASLAFEQPIESA